MFNTTNNTYKTENKTYKTNISIPNEFTIKSTNDDIQRIDFYLRNKDSFSEEAIWFDVLKDASSEILNKTKEYILKYYNGLEKECFNITFDNSKICMALNINSIQASIDVFTKYVLDNFNMKSNIYIINDLLNGNISIRMELTGRP